MLVHAKATRRASAAFAATCLCTLATPAPGQNLNEILNQLQGMAQSENIKRVQAEWNKLPQSEMACVTQKLSDRGDNVQSLARRGILPSDQGSGEVELAGCTVTILGPARAEQWTGKSVLDGDLHGCAWTAPRDLVGAIGRLLACEEVVDARSGGAPDR